MCIIFSCVSSRPDDETLIRAERRNDDGIGWAWREDGLVRWEKGIKIETLLNKLHTAPPPYPYVIHFRIATQGGEVPELCHPFAATPKASLALSGKAKAVLFHNGNWNGWETEVKQALLARKEHVPDGKWSDSRAMALLAGVYGPKIFNILNTGPQRIAYFSAKDLIQWGSWDHKDGWIASNPSYQNHSAGLNIEPQKDWERNPERFDPKAGKLVPAIRRPEKHEKLPTIVVISDGEEEKLGVSRFPTLNGPVAGSMTTDPKSELQLDKLVTILMQVRLHCKGLGYISAMEA